MLLTTQPSFEYLELDWNRMFQDVVKMDVDKASQSRAYPDTSVNGAKYTVAVCTTDLLRWPSLEFLCSIYRSVVNLLLLFPSRRSHPHDDQQCPSCCQEGARRFHQSDNAPLRDSVRENALLPPLWIYSPEFVEAFDDITKCNNPVAIPPGLTRRMDGTLGPDFRKLLVSHASEKSTWLCSIPAGMGSVSLEDY